MLTRYNVFDVSKQGFALLNGDKWQISRSLSRFLDSVSEKNEHGEPVIRLWWSNSEGHSPEQLAALEQYAQTRERQQREALEPFQALRYVGISRNDEHSQLYSTFVLQRDPKAARLGELVRMVRAVLALSVSLQPFAEDINASALAKCPEYRYRGAPCSIAADEDLWCILGEDRKGGSGVLEWCHGEVDAQVMLGMMSQHRSRFPVLEAKPWRQAVAH